MWGYQISLMFKQFFVVPGFVPAAEPLLFRQKWPKPVTPRLASCRGRTPVLGGRTNSLRSNKVRQKMRASSRGPAGRRRACGATSYLNTSLYPLSWGRRDVLWCRGSSRQPSHFGFGQSGQTHVGPGVALRVPCAVRRLRRRVNSRSLS